MAKWTVYVLHHSHTDIGYTERQERIRRWQIDFIRQAVEAGEALGERGFRWICETFWPVEAFLETADERERERFIALSKKGVIDLSASYLNMSELAGGGIQHEMIRRSTAFGESIGVPIRSALTADINGYGWGFSEALARGGVENLFSCVHTHHGLFPLYRKQIPFWWTTPHGSPLLVWNGDHYMTGNFVGLTPNPDDQEGTVSPSSLQEQLRAGRQRLGHYVEALEREGYPYTFVPLMISGLFTDNAPPNPQIIDLIEAWNSESTDIHLQMATLTEFFDHLRQSPVPIPEYSGDWPDWWSDGPASTPMHTQQFLEAQRWLGVIERMDPNGRVVDPNRRRQLYDDLILYAEHTWGYQASVSEPWDPFGQSLLTRKLRHAAAAHQTAADALDAILAARGDQPLKAQRVCRFAFANPAEQALQDVGVLYLERWEKAWATKGFTVIDCESQKSLPHQSRETPRGLEVSVPLKIAAQGERRVEIRPHSQSAKSIQGNVLENGVPRIQDVRRARKDQALGTRSSALWSPFVEVGWDMERGIHTVVDREAGSSLLSSDAAPGALMPVYDVTPAAPNSRSAMESRLAFGRNRQGPNAIQHTGRLVGAEPKAQGPEYAQVVLDYEVAGCEAFQQLLTVYRQIPRLDVRVRIHKQSRREAENLYVHLPFSPGPESEMWVKKGGALLRPWVDQLPGTLTDFYCILDGVCLTSGERGLLVAMPDTPLIRLQAPAFEDRLLQGDDELKLSGQKLYAWLMSNYWETNFYAELGGFYEFRYVLQWGYQCRVPSQALQLCESLNTGFLTRRSE